MTHEEANKRRYRTKGKAGETDRIPDYIPIISVKPWEDAITLRKSRDAHLIVLTAEAAGKLTYKNDHLYYNDSIVYSIDQDGTVYDSSNFPLATAQEQASIVNVDLRILRLLYGAILSKYDRDMELIVQMVHDDPRQFLSHNLIIYLPDLARAIGLLPGHISQESIDNIVQRICDYEKIFGEMPSPANPRYNTYVPAMKIIEYDRGANTLTFTSPYMNKIITSVLQRSIKTDKHGNPIRSASGKLIENAVHSRHTKSTIIKNRNQFACEIVEIIGLLLDQAGSSCSAPHISFRTIIDKIPSFRESLNALSTTTNRNRKLKQVFEKAWELLAGETDIPEKFNGIQLPDPKNPKYIPTMKTLDEVISFPHKGKI